FERARVAGRGHRALVHGERRVALARPLVGTAQEEQPAHRAPVLVVPGAVAPDRILDATLGEGDLSCRAVTERLAAPYTLGNGGFVLGEELAGAVGLAGVRVQPREAEVRPVFSGNGGQRVAPQGLLHLASGGVGCVAVVHVHHREPDRVFAVFTRNGALLVDRHRPEALGLVHGELHATEGDRGQGPRLVLLSTGDARGLVLS